MLTCYKCQYNANHYNIISKCKKTIKLGYDLFKQYVNMYYVKHYNKANMSNTGTALRIIDSKIPYESYQISRELKV